MRLFTLLFLITVTADAKKRRPDRRKPSEDRRTGSERRNMLGSNFSSPDDFNSDVGLIPVPFGHIFRDGIEDPIGGYKQPIDLLELHTMYLRDGPYARDLIKTHKKKFQLISYNGEEPRLAGFAPPPNNNPPPINDPRAPNAAKDQTDSFEREPLPDLTPDQNEPGINAENPYRRTVDKSTADKDNDTIIPFWNFEAILQRNIAEPPKYRVGDGKRPKLKVHPDMPPNYDSTGKEKYFARNSYALYEPPKKKSNSTTCDEFGKNAKFHPNDIVNIDWVPFYVWTDDVGGKVTVSRVHHFKYPTKKLVKQYRDNFGPNLNHSVDWDQPKLHLKAHTVEALLIAVDRTGLFDAIPFHQLPANPKDRVSGKIPLMKLRLKIVDPYLAMMYCSLDYANIMAISGQEPRKYEKCVSEASILKFRGPGLPVRRDFAAEAREAKFKALDAARREAEKYISLDEERAAVGL